MEKSVKTFDRMVCSKDTKDFIMNECVKEFLRHHPQFKGSIITQAQILRQIAEFYLKA